MRYLLSVLLLFSLEGYAQCSTFILSPKGDTLNCVDVQGRRQGPWVDRVESVRGERGYEEEGFYKHGKKEGVWRRYSLEGDLIALENYRWGQKDGRNVYFNLMGEPLREETWKAVNPLSPYDTVDVYDVDDPTKVIAKQVIKLEGTTLKHGRWKYFDPRSGTLEKTEDWVFDKPKVIPGSVEDELAPIDVAGTGEAAAAKPAARKPATPAKPKEVLEFEKNNSGKKKIRVRDGSTGG